MVTAHTPIEFLSVPDIAKQARPWAQEVQVGPPKGVDEEECLTASALIEPGQLGPYQVNEWRTFFKPNAEQIEALKNGGSVCFVMLSGQMVPHHAEVWLASTDSAPVTPTHVTLHYGVGTSAETFDIADDWIGKEEGEAPSITNLKNVPERAIVLAEEIKVHMSDGTTTALKSRGAFNE